MGGVNIHSQTKIDNVPVDNITDHGISSNWAYDHLAEADPHPQYLLTDGSKPMEGHLDFDLHEARNMIIQNLSSFVHLPFNGKIILNTVDNGLYYCISES